MESDKPRLIPDHIRYPGMVVAILGISFISQGFLLRAALSNGGPQIERDYYARSLNMDEAQELRVRRDALGWRVSATPTPDALIVRVSDRSGAPVEQLRGEVIAQRADRAEAAPAASLKPVQGHPGVYRAVMNASGAVWDLRVALKHDQLLAGRMAPWELRVEPAQPR
jgi:nitrogen fixation protein FixH